MKTGTILEGLRSEPPKACLLESAAHVGALSRRRLGVADDEVWVPNRCQLELVAFVFVAFRLVDWPSSDRVMCDEWPQPGQGQPSDERPVGGQGLSNVVSLVLCLAHVLTTKQRASP